MKVYSLDGVDSIEFDAMSAMIGTDFCLPHSFIAITKTEKGEILCITNDKYLCQNHIDAGKSASLVEVELSFV